MSKAMPKPKKLDPIKRPHQECKQSSVPPNGPKRSKNFSEDDISLLFDLVAEHDEILLNKKTDAVSTKYKDKIWKMVTKEFNAQVSKPGDPFSERTIEQIKNCHKNLQTRARKQLADEKSELYKTGGGVNPKTVSDSTRKMVAMAPHIYIPPVNKFDSDKQYVELPTVEAEEREASDGPQEDRSFDSQNAPSDVIAKCNILCEIVETAICDGAPSETVRMNGFTSSPVFLQHKSRRVVRNVPPAVAGSSMAHIYTPQPKPQSKKRQEKSSRAEQHLTINVEDLNSSTLEEPADSQDSVATSQFSASGDFEVNGSRRKTTDKTTDGEGKNTKYKPESKNKTPPARSRRLGSHILASQRFASLAQARMTIVELQLQQMKEQHQLELKIKQTQLQYEQARLKKLMSQ